MITASANEKAITTKGNREILGELIKGKLEREGYLERYQRITLDTLRNQGSDVISLKKIKDTLIVDVEKIISAYNLPEKNDAD